MAEKLAARKNSCFRAVSIAPSVNKTPGPGTPPVPYPVVQDLANSASTAQKVYVNGDLAYMLGQTYQPSCMGDQAGSVGGIVSGTVGGKVEPISASTTVRVEGNFLVRDGDRCQMNSGNTVGLYVTVPPPSGAVSGGVPTSTNPYAEPETPKERGFWGKLSGWVHGALDVAGFIPGLGAIPDLANAGIYALEGDMVSAGISAVAAIPLGGDAVKAGSMVYKGGKVVAKEVAEKAAKEAAEKVAKEAAERVAKEAAERSAKEAAERIAKEGAEKALKGTAKETAEEAAEKAARKTAREGAEEGAERAGKDGAKIHSRSLREQYLGRTPGKSSRTGREVQERMRAEGKLRDNAVTGKPEFQASDGNWYPLEKADMAHKTDAVTWWNAEGRAYGAKSPEVREWMLDPDNYVLDHYSRNRAAGPRIRQTYQPPLK